MTDHKLKNIIRSEDVNNRPHNIFVYKDDIIKSEKDVYDILSKLNFISKIKENEKIDLQSMSLVQVGYALSIQRTYANLFRVEDRNATYTFIEETLNTGFDMAYQCIIFENKDPLNVDIGNLIIKELHNSKIGVNNMIKTYHTDTMFTSKLSVLLQTLDTKLYDLDRKISIRV